MSKQQRTIRVAGTSNDKTLEIKYLLRDQKKEMAAIKRNIIFKELMRKPGERPGRQQNGTESGSPRRRGGREDTEAEGQIRMLDGIQDAAKKGQKDQRGVWSPFGKAYRCMGDFEELGYSLPKLERDLMQQENEGLKQTRRRKPYLKGERQSAPSVSALSAAEEEDDESLWKNRMMATTKDFREAAFPKEPLKLSDMRRKMHISSASNFVSSNEAAGDAMDPAQWGSWLYNSQDIREQMAEAAAAQNAKEAAVVQTPSTVAPTPASLTKVGSVSWDVASQQQDNTSGFEVEAGVADAMKLPPKPRWDPPLVKFEYPNRSVEEACVEDWRADFIKTRQGLRKNLQHELWRRAQERKFARQNDTLAAGFASYLLSDLEVSQGARQSYHRPGSVPTDIWHQAKYFMEHGARKGDNKKRPTAGPVDMEEIAILERFYNQLCLLVERQRVSDPCSIALLLAVKTLLEKGTTLVPTLLVGVVDALDTWAKTSGLYHYNQCILPILTFIRKCTGGDEDECQKMIIKRGLEELVFGEDAGNVKNSLAFLPAFDKVASSKRQTPPGSRGGLRPNQSFKRHSVTAGPGGSGGGRGAVPPRLKVPN